MNKSIVIFGGAILLLCAAGLYLLTSKPVEVSQVQVEMKENSTPSEVEAESLGITLVPHTLTLPDGTDATFRIAEPFVPYIAAEGLGKARFMAWSSDGRLFVPDIVDYKLSHNGALYVLGGFDEESGRFTEKHTYLGGLRGPNSVAFYTDADGNEWLYLALTAHLVRYPYTPGDTSPQGEGEIVATFPNTQTPGEESVVWHITRTLLFHDDLLYIAIGSGCNSCEQPEGELRGMVMVMEPDGSNAHVYADGLRNSVGIAAAEGSLYATVNGVDHLGADGPDEMMYRLGEGVHYGWPYCYEHNGAMVPDTTGIWNRAFDCSSVPRPLATFDPRSAPLGLTYFGEAHPLLRGSFLVALHGSFDVSMGTGNQVRRVDLQGNNDVFMDGFLTDSGERISRPVHFLQYDANSFFMTDDHSGVIYFIREQP